MLRACLRDMTAACETFQEKNCHTESRTTQSCCARSRSPPDIKSRRARLYPHPVCLVDQQSRLEQWSQYRQGTELWIPLFSKQTTSSSRPQLFCGWHVVHGSLCASARTMEEKLLTRNEKPRDKSWIVSEGQRWEWLGCSGLVVFGGGGSLQDKISTWSEQHSSLNHLWSVESALWGSAWQRGAAATRLGKEQTPSPQSPACCRFSSFVLAV